MEDFLGREEWDQGSYTRPGKTKVGSLFQGHFPLDNGRGLLGTLYNKY